MGTRRKDNIFSRALSAKRAHMVSAHLTNILGVAVCCPLSEADALAHIWFCIIASVVKLEEAGYALDADADLGFCSKCI